MMKQPRKRKGKTFKPIDYEAFREVRLINRLTISQVAKMLRVSSRTVMNWECGATRIPYSAFKLLRFIANGLLLPEAWKGWIIKGDTLWSPVGRPFRQHELTYLSHYFEMARYWQADYDARHIHRQEVKSFDIRPPLRLVLGGMHE